MVGNTEDRWRWSSSKRQGGRSSGGFPGKDEERHTGLRVVSAALPIQHSPGGAAVTRAAHLPATATGAGAARAFYLRVKRASDMVSAATGLLFLLPLYLLVAVLVALDSPGPILHRRRVLARQSWDVRETGPQPVTFDAFKFRTMRADADEYLAQNPVLEAAFLVDYKLGDDPRVTRLGRFLRRSSIDELPQLWNVLLGQMSLVGPRMITPDELPRYEENGAALLSVTPGLTGLWQVSGRANTGYRERVRLDMTYIHNRTLWLDTQILWKTVACVLAGRGAA